MRAAVCTSYSAISVYIVWQA